MSRGLAYACAAVFVAGLWLPWATLSIGLFGAGPQPIGELNGEEIGSNLLDLPVGWIAAAAGVAAAIAAQRRQKQLAVVAAIVALGVVGYAVLAIPGKETATANGEDVTSLVDGQVDYAWGLFVVTAAAIALLIVALRAGREVAEGPGPGLGAAVRADQDELNTARRHD